MSAKRGTLHLTTEFLQNKKIAINSVLDWIVENGGGCDCEVLANIEEHFI